MCEDWGHWIEKHGDHASYPSQAAIAGVVDWTNQFNWFRVRQLTAKGHGSLIFGGHRILCLDMPERIRCTNLMVNRLSPEQYDAILARYGLGVMDDGRLFTNYHRAIALGITEGAFEERLRRARTHLGEILAKATGYEYISC
jgi:hypothetical protein